MCEQKPWINANGELLSDNELKIISKNWSPDTWENYLQSLEHEEDEENFFLNPPNIEQTATKNFSVLVSDHTPLSKKFISEIHKAVDTLPERDKKIILASYWDGESERYQAQKAGVCRSTIYKKKRRIKKRLKNILTNESKRLDEWNNKK